MNLSRRYRLKLPRIEPTDEQVYFNRRQFLKQMGFAGVAGAGLLSWPTGCRAQAVSESDRQAILRPGLDRQDVLTQFPAPRNKAFNQLPGGITSLTDEVVASSYNNFYEFTTQKDRVWKLAQDFGVDPWSIEVGGLCHKPRTFNIDDIFKQFAGDMEERTYRFRCVEAWAMDVPWTGFELGKLLRAVEPMSDAKYVRFVSKVDRGSMDGVVSQPWYPWPYFEGLRMDEAMNELALLATGIYGRPLPRQHGSPFRLVLPWKYGYKGPKSIVRIELVAQQPDTFWNKLEPNEYGFYSNIDPAKPHPRWSQASERVIGTGERRATLPFGGYGEYVAEMYG